MYTQFATDKVSYHGFISFYKPIFDSIYNCQKVLEIGIGDGPSLHLLNMMFPTAIVYGIDINEKSHLNADRIRTYVGNQESREELEAIIKTTDDRLFDLIIDDGGHEMKQQQISLACLFKYVKPGGYYVVEDLHSSRMNDYINADCMITSLDMLIRYNLTRKIISNYMTDDEIKYLEQTIDAVYVWSKTDDMSQSVTSVIKKKL